MDCEKDLKAKINAPLFVAQGANDPRVKKAESDQIVEALNSRGIDVEYMVRDENTRKPGPPESAKRNKRINLILFIATLFTTTFAGTLMEVGATGSILAQLHKGLPFSLTLLTILLFHEFGHYFSAKFHEIKATLPYYIPLPLTPVPVPRGSR